MKLQITTAVLVLAVVPMLGQTTGVSNPDPAVITDSQDTPVQVKVKPAAGIPATGSTSSTEVYGPYVPYRGGSSQYGAGAAKADTSVSKAAFDPDANIVTSVERRPLDSAALDAGIVTSVAEREGEIREGTLLKARILQELSTTRTVEGSEFRAELTQAVEKDGRVILPAGSVLEGRVTEVHGGKRISGAAMMHLDPHSVTLPDGTQYMIHAQLIDTSEAAHTKVGSEGNLIRRDHPKETLTVIGGVTGAGAVAGAMMGGGVGAAVGAGIGAGAGTIVWLKQDRQATLPQDSVLVFSLTMPMVLRPLHAGVVGGQ